MAGIVMRVAIHNHQNKARGLAEALASQGHAITDIQPDVLLIDLDGPPYYNEIIDRAKRLGIPVWLYQHGAMAIVAWDGHWEPHPWTSGIFVSSDGYRQVLEAYGYPKRIELVGWHWCAKRAFEPRPPRRVLFAPVHPLSNGFMRPKMRAANRKAFKLLREMPVHLTVRYIGDLRAQGLKEVEGVEYVRGVPDNSTADIDAADVVVSWGTFAHLAVARGRPTVMYAQDTVPEDGHDADSMRQAENWEKYAGILRYPHELFEGSAWGVVQDAASGNYQPREWTQNFIGEQLNPQGFSELLTRIVQESKK